MTLSLSVTRGRAFYRVLHDFETDEYGHAPRPNAPTPEMVKTLDDRWIDLTAGWQWFWYEQLRLSAGYSMAPSELQQAWRGLTTSDRAFTNGRGTDLCRDFISDRNEGAGLPGEETLTCGGKVALCVGDPIHMSGQDWLPFMALDGSEPPPLGVNYKNSPWLFTPAVIAYPDGRVGPFPQLNGCDVPAPFVSKGGVSYLPAKRVVRLEGGLPFPGPYIPPR